MLHEFIDTYETIPKDKDPSTEFLDCIDPVDIDYLASAMDWISVTDSCSNTAKVYCV